jgi:ATPases with chaperone activity, ATP-binding subunit
MYKFEKFTEKANNALNLSIESAGALGHDYIGSEHILLGLIEEGTGVAYTVLNKLGITAEAYKKLIEEKIGKNEPKNLTPDAFTPRSKRILQIAIMAGARLNNASYVGTEHLLIAILEDTQSYAVRFMQILGTDPARVATEIGELFARNNQQKYTSEDGMAENVQNSAGKSLEQYGRDLTQMAAEGKIDPVIGRTEEIERVVQILSRRTKNNPVLIGEPGVGKTAVAEGLALKIKTGEVPEILKGKRIFSLDLTGMVAGTKYRGEFEERIKSAIEEVKKDGDIILFIDELHTIIGTGAAEGSADAANILKPSLARGDFQVIGATTINEYRKHIEKDAALERRFQPVKVGEPTEAETVEILKGLKDRYEVHHKVSITEESIEAAVTLSSRYITDRFLPDKAIDLIDEAGARVRLRSYTAPEDLQDLEKKIKELEAEKAAAVNNQDFESAAELRDKQKEMQKKLEKVKEEWTAKNERQGSVVKAEDIAEIVSMWTGVPVTQLTEEEGKRLLRLEEIMHERISGQDEAVTAVSKAIRRGRVGLKDKNRPIGSFIFLGPTGVGKTELSKTLAEAMFGDEKAIIRFDMSEYMEKHTVSRLVGSPPGYVGYDEGGQLTEAVRRKPYSVVLFDEIEKAHSDIFNILLQILEDGRITDSQGRTVDFKNTVIILTSNVGARLITNKQTNLGFSELKAEENDYEKTKELVLAELKHLFKPEFLNRVDDIIVFHKLSKENTAEIVNVLMNKLQKKLEEMDIKITFTQNTIEAITDKGYDETYGARPLRRAIQRHIEDFISEEMLEKRILSTEEYVVDYKDNKFVIEKRISD